MRSEPVSRRPPNLGTTIFLYTTGIFLVLVAVLLLLQSLGVIPALADIVYIALLLLAVGSGVLYGVGSRT